MSVKKAAALYLSALLLLPTLWQPSHAAESSQRAALTQAILELQRDLLLSREQLLPSEHAGLAIYLNVDTLQPLDKGDRLNISIDGQAVIEVELDAQQLEPLMAGGMQQLHITPLNAGPHTIQTSYRSGGKRNTKTLILDKSNGRDNLKITLTKIQPQQAPEIFFEHEAWNGK